MKNLPISHNPPPLPAKKQKVEDICDWSSLKSRKILRISILDGRFGLSKPWSEMLAIKILSESEGEVGMTRFINGSNTPIWNQEILTVLDQKKPDLMVGVVHFVDNTKYQIRQYQSLITDGLIGGIPQQVQVKVAEKGYLNLLLEIIPDVWQELNNVVDWICKEHESKIAKLFSDQVIIVYRCRMILKNVSNQFH